MRQLGGLGGLRRLSRLWRRPSLDLVRGVALFAASLVVVLSVWQWASVTERVSALILPRPTDIWSELVFFFQNFFGEIGYWHHTWVTVQEILLGFAIAALAAFVLGAVVGESRLARDLLMPYAVTLNATPKVAFVPVFVVWLGFGMAPKVVIAALIAFFPVFVNTISGMQALDLEQVELLRSLRASRWQTFKLLKLFNALPFVFAGLKTAMVLSVIGAIVAEFGGASEGIGYLIDESSSRLRADQVFAYVIVLSVVGYALFEIINLVERKVVFWVDREQHHGRLGT
jgi:NitT/TauT family transport system permease protein